MVKQKETNVDDVNFCKTTRHMKYSMKPMSATKVISAMVKVKVRT